MVEIGLSDVAHHCSTAFATGVEAVRTVRLGSTLDRAGIRWGVEGFGEVGDDFGAVEGGERGRGDEQLAVA